MNENIPDEQIASLKESLINQVNSNEKATSEQKESFKKKVESMNKEEFISFLESQGIIGDKSGEQKCIFCSIIGGEVSSYVIWEDSNSKAVLDINPISKGHTLIIPKEHSKEIPKEVKEFAEKVSKRMEEKLSPKEVKSEEHELFGHRVINLISIYDDNTLKNERKEASKEELGKMLEILYHEEGAVSEPVKNVEEKPITDKNTWLPKRIP